MYELKKIQDIMVIQLFGEISSMEKDKIFQLIDSVVSHGSRKIIFDLQEISHLHHRTALDISDKIKGFQILGVEFVISQAPKKVKDVIVFTRMNQIVDLFDHLNEALLYLTNQKSVYKVKTKSSGFELKDFDQGEETKYLRH